MAPKKPARKSAPAKKQSTSGSRAAAKKKVPVKAVKATKKTTTKAVPGRAAAKKAKALKKAPAAKKAPAKKAPAKKAKAPAAKAEKAPAKAVKATATVEAEPEKKPVSSVLIRKVPPRKPGSVICPLSGFEVMPQPANLSDKTVGRLRKKLVDERERHIRQADELEAEAEALALERDPGDTQFDEESGEGDTMNVERERDLVLSASARQIVDSIDRALERMKKNTYGLCVPAGRRIALERLEAIPYAEECVDCKARAERRR